MPFEDKNNVVENLSEVVDTLSSGAAGLVIGALLVAAVFYIVLHW